MQFLMTSNNTVDGCDMRLMVWLFSHLRVSPFLGNVTIIDQDHSLGMLSDLQTLSQMFSNSSTRYSPPAFIISPQTPSTPVALLFFSLAIAPSILLRLMSGSW